MNTALIYVILFIILGLAAIIFIPQLMLRRAANRVVRIFRKKNATSPQTAMTLEELKLQPRSFLQNMMSLRDYKPAALDMLVRGGIVIMTPDERYYLSEPVLMNTALGRRLKK